MNIQIEHYTESIRRLPSLGQHIIGHQQNDRIVVYQAYNHAIADYAVLHNVLGGPHYSYNRMSWIKPNFLWMMYRCGWATKENQERVLAIWLSKTNFEAILKEAVYSSYAPDRYSSHDAWKKELEQKEVRLQWDPDHDPYGAKLDRRAIQLGLKGEMLRKFGNQYITAIEDITDFVSEQKQWVDASRLDKLQVPFETTFNIPEPELAQRIGADQ